ncbi:MAG TPA: ABC transporter permease [Alphaproteobacteria bacterium]|nr:ABC transporter permease [Alphaproteobacteria bacterium]
MSAYVARRLLQGIVVLFIVSFIAFAIFQYIGDPAVTMAGQYATAAQEAAIRKALGLDQPFYIQYLHFIANAVGGNLGMSYVAKVPVLGLILERLPASLELAFTAEVGAVIFGVALGVLSAAYPRSVFSKATLTGSLFGVSLPTFLVGILLILVFAVWLGWLPPFGRGDVVPVIDPWSTGFLTASGWAHLALPAITLGMFQLALLYRLTRNGMVEILRADYIRTARAKGLGRWSVLFKHALRNVLIPVITMVGLQLGQLIGFSIVTESIFQWPGAGNLLLTSLYESDFPVVAAYIIIVALIVVGLNLLVDISYALLNPRIRYD